MSFTSPFNRIIKYDQVINITRVGLHKFSVLFCFNVMFPNIGLA